MGQIRADISSIYTISEAMSQLDVLYALCKYALTTLRCVRPRFSKYATAISNGRHPVLELVKNEIPVPNNTVGIILVSKNNSSCILLEQEN